MKKANPSTCILSCLIAICIGNTAVLAQHFPTTTTIKTPYGPRTIQTGTYSPAYNYYNVGSSNRKHIFTVVFLNDSSVEVKTKINLNDSIHTLSWGKKGNETTVKPTDTKEIYRMENGEIISGIPHDSCWLFVAKTGKIITYSITSELDMPLIKYMQSRADGPILLITKENVLELVKENEKAVRIAENGNLIRAIRVYNND
jgi:hypothetical protein